MLVDGGGEGDDCFDPAPLVACVWAVGPTLAPNGHPPPLKGWRTGAHRARPCHGSLRAGRDALMAGLVLAELGLDSSATVRMTVNSLTLRQAQDGMLGAGRLRMAVLRQAQDGGPSTSSGWRSFDKLRMAVLRQAQDGNGATPPWVPRRRSVCCAWM